MRKEIVYAVILGIGFGLVVAFGIWKTNKKLQEISEINPSPTPTSSPTTIGQIAVSIAKPENYSVSDKSVVVVSGITSPEVWVAISGEDNYYLIKSGSSGIFQQEVNLTGGVNEIVCTAFDKSGKSASDKITLVYSSEFNTARAETTPASSDSAEIRQKIQAKVEEKLKKPQAYLGTATDISEGTIQITDMNNKSEIRQISVDAETTYVKSGKETKTVKFADMAIGDFVVAMGYANGNSVLSAQRILITDPIIPTKRRAFMANKVTVNKNVITVNLIETGQEIIIKKLDTKTKIDKLDPDDRIIIIGTETGDYLEAKKIFLL